GIVQSQVAPEAAGEDGRVPVAYRRCGHCCQIRRSRRQRAKLASPARGAVRDPEASSRIPTVVRQARAFLSRPTSLPFCKTGEFSSLIFLYYSAFNLPETKVLPVFQHSCIRSAIVSNDPLV